MESLICSRVRRMKALLSLLGPEPFHITLIRLDPVTHKPIRAVQLSRVGSAHLCQNGDPQCLGQPAQ